MNLQLGLPLLREPQQMLIVQSFGSNGEDHRRFGLQGHNGLDFEVEEGELVVAVDEGIVMEIRCDPVGYGVTVKLSHPWGESRYAHGQWLSVPIEFGLGHTVRQGERIFLAGSTSMVERARLHLGLRIRKDDGSLDYSAGNGFGGYEDPLPYLHQALGLPEVAPPPTAAVKGKKKAA